MTATVDIQPGLTKEFFDLVKRIGEATSKQEEEQIIKNEVGLLKKGMAAAPVSARLMKEYLVRAVYCEMMGTRAEFAYIHAINLTQDGNLLNKRTGYLAINLFLNENHELVILLVNAIRRDLLSMNHLEVCAGLTAVSKVLSAEMMPAIMPQVKVLLEHAKPIVRKKAVMALQRINQKAPELLTGMMDDYRRVLCDRDPSVMSAALILFYDLVHERREPFVDLVPSFVSILKQVAEHRLSKTFEYHKVPAPWIQIKLLKILAILGQDNQSGSEMMYEVLKIVMHHANCGVFAGFAVVYECVKTITRIYAHPVLLEQAATMVSRFVTSKSQNLKYIGITALADIVRINPAYAVEHQLVVLDCLEGRDDTIKRKTLDLLYQMTNPKNVVTIVDKLLTYLRTSVDGFLRKDLVSRIVDLAERFAPDTMWYVQSMCAVMEYAGDLIQTQTAHNLARLIAEGTGEDEEADVETRRFAVELCLDLAPRQSLTDTFISLIAWVLGEYAYLYNEWPLTDVMDVVCEMTERRLEDPHTRGVLITALQKLVAQHGSCPHTVHDVVNKYATSPDLDIQQRCAEFKQLLLNQPLMTHVLPVDASCEDIEVDPELGFLNIYVQRAITHEHARPYVPRAQRETKEEHESERAERTATAVKSTLRFAAYDNPTLRPPLPPSQGPPRALPAPPPGAPDHSPPRPLDGTALRAPAPAPALGLDLSGVQQKWGSSGYAAAPAPAPAAASPLPPIVQEPPRVVSSGFDGDNRSGSDAESAHWRDNVSGGRLTPAAPVERVLSDRERLAGALFEGIGGDSTSPPVRGGRGVRGISPRGPPSGESTPVRGVGVRPRPGGRGLTTPPPAPAPASTPLLGIGSPAAAPASPISPMPAAPKASLLDLFGDMASPPAAGPLPGLFPSLPSSPPVAAAPAPAPAGPRPSLDSLLDLAPAMRAAVPAALGEMAVPAAAEPELREHARSHEAPSAVGGDGTLEVLHYRVWQPEALAVVLFVRNSSASQADDVAVMFQHPDGLAATYQCEPQPVMGHNRCTFAAVAPSRSVCMVVKYTLARVSPRLAMSAQVSYRQGGRPPAAFSVMIPLSLKDLVRPLELPSDKAFAEQWGRLRVERKATCPAPPALADPAALTRKLVADSNVHRVAISGMEGIMAGKVISIAQPAGVCLLHGKVVRSAAGATIELTVRAMDVPLAESLVRLCQQGVVST